MLMHCGEVGGVSPGVCSDEAAAEPLSEASGSNELFRDLAPCKLFLSLNFSIQVELIPAWSSDRVVVVAEKARTCSQIMSSVSSKPFLS